MKPIKAYQTTDGKIFTDIEEATSHQAYLDSIEEIDRHPLYANNDKVDAEDLIYWLTDNKQLVLDILSSIKN
jgi:hypothetical protein